MSTSNVMTQGSGEKGEAEVTPTLLGHAASDSDPPHQRSASRGDWGPRQPRASPYRMLSRSATILSRSWKAQSLRHLATSASWRASFSSWHRALHCFRRSSASLLALPASSVTVSLIWWGQEVSREMVTESSGAEVPSSWCGSWV